ncbi:Shedu immune nuclease family protein [Streptosporangium sp. NPDC087985]|uniref:Shedu immune nuclease family protein n=1 Tax=Streptosporangium sp. NPDC087985 TaxID=3366196 RepID=UPI003820B050
MSEEEIAIRSTSRNTADIEPIVLRSGERARLVFKPELVAKQDDAPPVVRGTFVYQKKRPSGVWQNYDSINLSSLKDGEGVRLALRSEEVSLLHETLARIYDIAEQHGIPRGQVNYIREPRNNGLRHLLEGANLEQILDGDVASESIVQKFLDWLTNRQANQLSDFLGQLDSAQLLNFDAAVGAARLKAFLQKYEASLGRADEPYWHNLLKGNNWVLSQVYAQPIIIIDDQVYVGGKGIDNRDGNVADFLYGNRLTEDVALIEIKTPKTDLLSSQKYRNNTWSPSSELSGASQQILVNKRSLVEEYRCLAKEDDPTPIKAFNPRALLIVGNAKRELDLASKRRCFELYRRNLRDIDIVTFDELHSKARQLIDLFENF